MDNNYQGNYYYDDNNQPVPKPENNMVLAILTTLLFCWPVGIVAIVYADKVNSLWRKGDYEGAQKAAKISKKISLYNIIIVGGLFVLCMLLALISSVVSE